MVGRRRASSVRLGGRAGLALVVGLLAGCTGPVGGSAGAGTPAGGIGAAGPSATALQPVLVSTQAWPGPNRILLTVEDAANRPLTGPDLAVRVTFRELAAGAAGVVLEATGSYVRVVPDGRGLIELDVVLARAGRWRLDVAAALPGGPSLTGWTELVVRPDGATPAIGSPAPAAATPTAAEAGGRFDHLTGDPIPEKSLYWLSAADALAAHRAFVLVLDSYAFKVSQSCGGALGLVRHLGETFPTISFINAEPWRTRFEAGRLSLDPPGGPAGLAPWSVAWGIDTAPWVFVVDADGIVRAKFAGVFGTEELRAALRAVAGWSPTALGRSTGPTIRPG